MSNIATSNLTISGDVRLDHVEISWQRPNEKRPNIAIHHFEELAGRKAEGPLVPFEQLLRACAGFPRKQHILIDIRLSARVNYTPNTWLHGRPEVSNVEQVAVVVLDFGLVGEDSYAQYSFPRLIAAKTLFEHLLATT